MMTTQTTEYTPFQGAKGATLEHSEACEWYAADGERYAQLCIVRSADGNRTFIWRERETPSAARLTPDILCDLDSSQEWAPLAGTKRDELMRLLDHVAISDSGKAWLRLIAQPDEVAR